MDSLGYQVSLTMGDHTEDFDIDAIVAEITEKHGRIKSIDSIDSDEYWEIVRRHDKSDSTS